MSYYKVVGRNVSHRNPFHGAYIQPDMYDFDVAALDKRLVGVQGFGQVDATQLWAMSKSPLLRGLLVGATAWGIAKAVGADATISRRVGMVSGGLEAVTSMVSNWLRKQVALPTAQAPGEPQVPPGV